MSCITSEQKSVVSYNLTHSEARAPQMSSRRAVNKYFMKKADAWDL